MAKRKTTKKPTVTEPVIEYVDPETNLETPEVDVKTPPQDDFFKCMKSRRDKEK